MEWAILLVFGATILVAWVVAGALEEIRERLDKVEGRLIVLDEER